jgi:LuxR family maltose regulon positive regulatory protein
VRHQLAAGPSKSWTGAGFDLFDSKLEPPSSRPAIVPRPALVNRLDALPRASVIANTAPAGYGKTTLLTQWAAHGSARVAWLSLDERDNDPEILLAYAAAALDRVEPVDPEIYRRRSPGSFSIASTAVLRLTRAMASMQAPVALVLDHAEVLHNPVCRDAVAELSVHLPPGAQLAIATRETPPVPLVQLRTRGVVLELGAADLAMDTADARALLANAGVHVAPDAAASLVERTEGWPAGLYFGALALNAGGEEGAVEVPFAGDDRMVAEYLRSELLERLSPDQVTFLTRTSVLDRMCGPMCDAVLEGEGSAEILRSLEDSNLLLVALDRRREWYRYHHLFRDLLHAELERREPERVGPLHLRAATWADEQGYRELALEHAQRGGDTQRAADLILALAQPTWATGRIDTVLRWMDWIEREGLIEQSPAVAVHGALIYALLGRPIDAERWVTAVERLPAEGTLDDGSTLESYFAYLRATLGRNGVDEMRRDAEIASGGLSPASPYRPTMLHAAGMCDLLEGNPAAADSVLAHAVDAALRSGAAPFAATILAERATIAIDRDDWTEAGVLSDRAHELVRESAFEDYWTSALVFAVASRVACRRGDIDVARENVARATRLRPLLTYALPVVSVFALLELAQAYIALADTAGAREVLRQAQDIVQQRPNLGVLTKRVEDLRARLDVIRAGSLGASSLTTAELRLVPLLQTHLTFPEIGERLHLSRHTIKTQAISIYQKLGVSSRSEAIDRMRDIGLLDS